jgi:hypothetical protein
MRRPLTSTSVATLPRPRMPTPDEPVAKLPELLEAELMSVLIAEDELRMPSAVV